VTTDMSTAPDAAGPPADWLHARVCELRRRTRRRLFDPVLDVAGGFPLRPLVGRCLPAGEPLDHGLRVDLLLSLYDDAHAASSGRLHLVVTRSGAAVLESTDLAWAASWRTACAVAGDVAGTTTILTRYGFVDVASGVHVRTPPRRHRR